MIPARLFTLLALGVAVLQAAAAAGDITAGEATAKALYSHLKNSAAAKENLGVEISTDPDARQVTVSYLTKKWLVYGSMMNGEWTENPSEEVGPKADGFVISIRITTKKDAAGEQWAGRDQGLHLETIFDRGRQKDNWGLLRRPYWTDYGTSIPIPERGLVAQINVSFNNRPNKALITRFADEIRQALSKSGD